MYNTHHLTLSDDDYESDDQHVVYDRRTTAASAYAQPLVPSASSTLERTVSVDNSITTMNHAVSVPQALRRAGRRTLLDVLSTINSNKKKVNTSDNNNSITTAEAGVEEEEEKEKKAAPIDYSRSIKHLLPRHLSKHHAQHKMQEEEQQNATRQKHEGAAAVELNISDFSDDDDDDDHVGQDKSTKLDVDNHNNTSHLGTSEASWDGGGRIGPRSIARPQPRRTVAALMDAVDSPPRTHGSNAMQRSSAGPPHSGRNISDLLFNDDDDDNEDTLTPHKPSSRRMEKRKKEIKPKARLFDMSDCDDSADEKKGRGTTPRRASLWVEGMLNNNADSVLSHTGGGGIHDWDGHNSTAVAAPLADIPMQQRRLLHINNQALRGAADATTTDAEEECLVKDPGYVGKPMRLVMASAQATRRPTTTTTGWYTEKGRSEHAFPLEPPHLLYDGADESHQQSSNSHNNNKSHGRSKNKSSEKAFKHLANNTSALQTVQYLMHSFDHWRLDGHALMQQSCEMPLTLDNGGGVELRLKVTSVDSSFGVACVRGCLTWISEKVTHKLFPSSTAGSSTTHGQGNNNNNRLDYFTINDIVDVNNDYCVVLSESVAQAISIRVGQHLYLAEPMWCLPELHTIMGAYNATTDTLIHDQCTAYEEAVRVARLRVQQQLTPTRSSRSRQSRAGSNASNNEVTTPSRPSAGGAEAAEDVMTPFRTYYDPLVLALGGGTATAAAAAAGLVHDSNRNELGTDGVYQRNTPMLSVMVPSSSNYPAADVADSLGEGFPRGPGLEWEVPLEVLQLLASASPGVQPFAPFRSCYGDDAMAAAAAAVSTESVDGREDSNNYVPAYDDIVLHA